MEWQASHILVSEQVLAQEIINKAKAGADFGALARQYSSCPSKSSGGDLGWFGPGMMVQPFEAACKNLFTGSISDVVQTQFGYHVIKLTGKRD